MKYLRKFNESVNETTQNILELYISIIDKFNLTELYSSDYVVFYNKSITLEITRAYLLDQTVQIVRLGTKTNGLYGEGFDMISDTELASMMKDTSEACYDLLDSKDMFVGSFKNTLEVIFFPEKVNLKKYKDCKFYGSNAIVELDGGFLHSNQISHKNCFDLYHNNGQINGIYSIYGYYGVGWFYNVPITIIVNGEYDKVIGNRWVKVCTEKNIKNMQHIRKNYKVSVTDFMQLLKDIKIK